MPVRWSRRVIAAESYEAACVCDVDRDGIPDIVSGGFWYKGPGFTRRTAICEVKRVAEYHDDFSAIPIDVDGDGWLDIIAGGWWGDTVRWRRNPGEAGGDWEERVIAHVGNVETTRTWDVDGDGRQEVVPNCPGGPLMVFKLDTDAAGNGRGTFTAHTVHAAPQGHGLGFGDVNGDGRGDFVLAHGWLEAPDDPWQGDWVLHPEWDLGGASIPILVVDVNGDGLNDLIVGQAHGYGLDWIEQVRQADGAREWRRHPIDPFNAQYHEMQWADIDGDGQSELVTGKRFRAHNDNEPGWADDLGIYYFKWNGESFSKQVIAYGAEGTGSGCGIQFALADLRGSGRLDVVAPGKDGLVVYFNEGA